MQTPRSAFLAGAATLAGAHVVTLPPCSGGTAATIHLCAMDTKLNTARTAAHGAGFHHRLARYAWQAAGIALWICVASWVGIEAAVNGGGSKKTAKWTRCIQGSLHSRQNPEPTPPLPPTPHFDASPAALRPLAAPRDAPPNPRPHPPHHLPRPRSRHYRPAIIHHRPMALLAALAMAASTAALDPGDAMVVSLYSNVSSNNNKYAVVLLDTLLSGETISVTDDSWVSATCAARHDAPPLTAQ